MSSRPLTSLSYASRREVVERVAPAYRKASCAQKTLLLDTVVTMTGYARKYAIRLLNQAPEGKRVIQRQRLPRYGPQVQHALVLVWEASRYICETLDPVFTYLCGCTGATWTPAADRGEPKPIAPDKHVHR